MKYIVFLNSRYLGEYEVFHDIATFKNSLSINLGVDSSLISVCEPLAKEKQDILDNDLNHPNRTIRIEDNKVKLVEGDSVLRSFQLTQVN
jgi:hypothetical protein